MNVLVQTFHAITYVIIVDAGVNAYIKSENWLFMALCIAFLFQGEKILRAIFGIKSAAGTMGDLSAAGLAGYAMAKSVAGGFKKKKNKDDDKDDEDDEEEDDDEDKDENGTHGAQTHVPNTHSQHQPDMGSSDNNNSVAGNNSEPSQQQGQDISVAQKFVTGLANDKRNSISRRVMDGAAGFMGGFTGGVMAGTYGLATGSGTKALTYAVAGGAGGKKLGKVLVKPIKGITNAYAGKRLKKAIMNGEYDNALAEAGYDLNSLEASTADLIRQALAEQASAATLRGEEVGNQKFWKTIDKRK